LKLGADGSAVFGTQRYRALVFVNPDYEKPTTFAFLRRVAASKTALFLRGQAETGWDGRPLPRSETSIPNAHANPTPSLVAEFLWNWHSPRDKQPSDLAKLTDGTCILARGEKNPAGDEIREDFTCGQTEIHVEATGVFGIRIGPAGELQALAASGLRRIDAGNFHLNLPEPTDLALWRTGNELHGVVQGAAIIPAELLQITRDWSRLDLAPLAE
jgi:hypothetical protein